MKKDKEWLKDMLKNEQCYSESKELKGTEKMPFGELYGRGVRGGIGKALELVEELDEPQKTVIPQFVADCIEEERAKIRDWHTEIPERFFLILGHKIHYTTLANANFSDWVFSGNEEKLYQALKYGYGVEKEKLYYLRLRDEDLPLYKAYDMKRWKYKLVYSAHHLRNENFLTVTFSESEIENMDIRSFELEEVTE